MKISRTAAVYVISVAAELAGMHPQTLRQYDRLGLVRPERTAGRGRRYSAADIARLQQIQQLSQDEGINLAGIKKIMELQSRVEELSTHKEQLQARLAEAHSRLDQASRVFAAGTTGDVISISRGQRPAGSPVARAGTTKRRTRAEAAAGSGALVLYRQGR